MRILTTADLEDIAFGAAVLGTGGGGDPYIGKLLARVAIERNGPVTLIDLQKGFDPFARSSDGNPVPVTRSRFAFVSKTAFIVGALLLAFLCAYYTSWQREADKLFAAMAELEGTDGDEHGGDHGSMPGMLTSAELASLEDADDEAFGPLWLELMIAHHEGAVEMAQTQQATGTFRPAVELAEEIEASQTVEIETMRGLLD